MLVLYKQRLKTMPLQKIFKSVYKRSQEIQTKTPDHIVPPEKIARLIIIAGRLVPFSTCLSQALAGKILFAENGYDAELHIGVCNDTAAGFEAHAWLVMDSSIILGHLPDLSRFKEFPPLLSKGPV